MFAKSPCRDCSEMQVFMNLDFLAVPDRIRPIALDFEEFVIGGNAREALNLCAREAMLVRRKGLIVHENRKRWFGMIYHAKP
jgi:hypothetical protein